MEVFLYKEAKLDLAINDVCSITYCGTLQLYDDTVTVAVQHTLSNTGGNVNSAGGATELGEYCQLEMFRATCSEGHVVVMKSALYGRMRLGRCVQRDYGFIGCSNDVTAHVDRLCSGRQGCEFQVAELHKNQPCPADLTPYLQASYECVPGS